MILRADRERVVRGLELRLVSHGCVLIGRVGFEVISQRGPKFGSLGSSHPVFLLFFPVSTHSLLSPPPSSSPSAKKK